MVELVFYPFAVAFATVVIVLFFDAILWSRTGRNVISASVSIISHAILLYLAWSLWQSLGSSGQVSISVSNSPWGSSLQLNLAGLYVFAIAALLGVIVSIYSARYMMSYRNSAIFYSLLTILTVSIYGTVVSGDLLTLFIFWEGMSICAYGLVAFRKTRSEALEASVKYLLLAGVGSIVALFGIAITYAATGALNLASIVPLVAKPTPTILLGLALIITGFGVEAAIAPLHTWLPDAYLAAPSPASAVLSGIVTATGIFTIMRLVAGSFLSIELTKSLQPLLVVFALVTMVVGNLSAYYQDDLKRLLAFSSIAQIGYILLGFSTLSVAGISASLFHIWNNALLKGLFFLLAGLVTFSVGTRSLSEMAGLGRIRPFLGLMLSLNALAMTGVPPFGMFWSEFLLVLSAVATNSLLLLLGAIFMLLNIALSIGYYFRIIRRLVFDPESDYLKTRPMVESRIMFIPCLILVSLSLLTGLYPAWFYDPASRAIQTMINH